MHSAVKEAVLLHERAVAFHADAYRVLKLVSDMTKKGNALTQEERADLIYFMKHVGDIFEDIKKEAHANRELLDNVLCAVYTASGAAAKERSVKGNIAVATPDVKVQATCPSATKEPTRYGMLMRALGVTNEDTIARGLLTVHWPRMVEYCTELSREGKPLPDGIDPEHTKPKYSTSVRLRSDVDLEEVRKQAKS